MPNSVVEIWQANAAGRYIHAKDNWDAPIDPNFTGAGRVITDAEGRYRFVTIRPGAYPWGNHHNAWRPAHIHLSLLGPAFATRLVTQMYFPDDPLIEIDPIANAVPMPYRQRMVAASTSRPPSPTGRSAICSTSCFADARRRRWRTTMTSEARLDNQSPALFGQTPSQTVGPFFHYGLPWKGGADLVGSSDMGARADLFPQEHDLLNVSRRARAAGRGGGSSWSAGSSMATGSRCPTR